MKIRGSIHLIILWVILRKLSGAKVTFSDCQHASVSADEETYTCGSSLKLETPLYFYLKMSYTGDTETEFGATLNIMKPNGDAIYHLDFRINMKGGVERIVQDSQQDNRWQAAVFHTITNLMESNEVVVTLKPLYYDVTFNGESVSPQLYSGRDQLEDYSSIQFYHKGSCFTFDLAQCYMENIFGEHSVIQQSIDDAQ